MKLPRPTYYCRNCGCTRALCHCMEQPHGCGKPDWAAVMPPEPAKEAPMGWQCPCCRVVHAPGVKECRCAVTGPLSLECPRCEMTGPCKDPDCRHPLAGARAQV